MVEPEVIINNQWSDRYTVIEVSGLDRPGLLYELTTAISKLNLNIASAHVATFGERARDVFYVTDLLGAQINAPTRQAAIKSALVHLLANGDAGAREPYGRLARRHAIQRAEHHPRAFERVHMLTHPPDQPIPELEDETVFDIIMTAVGQRCLHALFNDHDVALRIEAVKIDLHIRVEQGCQIRPQ